MNSSVETSIAARQTPGKTPPSVLHCVFSVGIGGLETMLLELAKGTDRRRFTPQVVCLQETGELAPRFEAAGIPLALIDRPYSGGPATLASLVRFLRRTRPTILHTHTHGAQQHAALARLAVPVPVHIHTRHDRWCAESWKGRFFERTATRLTDMTIAVSRDAALVAERLDGARKERLRTIHNGVDLQTFSGPVARQEGWRVVHVSRLQAVKDQASLLRAAALVSRHEPRFTLDIVGDGEERAALERLSLELGLSSVVTFHGMQSDVRPFLSDANLFVLSSTSEGLAMTLLEAMAMGLPIVATDVGGNREVVLPDANGVLVPPSRPEALAAAIIDVLATPGKARAFGAAGRARTLREFSLETMVASYHALYDEMLIDRGTRLFQGRMAA